MNNELVLRLLPILKKHFLPLGLGLLGLMFLVYGLIVFLGNSQPQGNDMVFESSGTNATSSSQINQSRLAVDVEGAVVKNGVYKLPFDSRIQDALIAAGGLSSTADRAWVEKNLNLAAKLTDGAKVYIPRIGESESIKGITSIKGSANATGQININSASESELDRLPGVGPVTAQKIISGRPYGTIEDLINKKIVSSTVFGQIKDKISVY